MNPDDSKTTVSTDTSRKTCFYVRGLDCVEEVKALRRALKPLVPHDDCLGFDLVRGQVIVNTACCACEPQEICDAIKRTGFEATVLSEGRQQDTATRWNRAQRLRLVLGASGAIGLIGGFLIHALQDGWVSALTAGEATGSGYPIAARIFYLLGTLASLSPFVPRAWAALRALRADMNVLMTVAVTGALLLGNFFEAATVSFLFHIALLVESWSVSRAHKALTALAGLLPRTARIRIPGSDSVEERPIEAVPVGSIIVVAPGERIPLDAVIVQGTTQVNQAPMTGESTPVVKSVGDEILTGTINGEGLVEARVVRPASDTMLARIVRMVMEAQQRRAPVQQWVDRFASYYTPLMMIAAGAVWLALPLGYGASWREGFYEALVVLLIACPCALVISTPVAIVAALTTAAKNGILIKGGAYLERAGIVRALAFDKTGTLTYGKPQVKEIRWNDASHSAEQTAYLAGLERFSQHPYAQAIFAYAQENGIRPADITDIRIIPGRGILGRAHGATYWAGNASFMSEQTGVQPTSDLMSSSHAAEEPAPSESMMFFGRNSEVLARIVLEDVPRPETREVVAQLHHMGVRPVVLISGDRAAHVKALAEQIGVDRYFAECAPDQKLEIIRTLQREYASVAMVGDGINDAPALAGSDLGIAMGAMGTDAAIESADIALLTSDIKRIPWLIGYARRTLRLIKTNVTLAIGIKGAVFLASLMGVGTLWLAIVADMGASLLVTANALRLLRHPTTHA